MRISGVYKLTFPNKQTYIGKSVDIERRWLEHKDSFLKGTAAKKLQTAYILSGMPSGSIIQRCHPDHIDLLESVHILIEMPALNTNVPIKLGSWEIDVLRNNIDVLLNSTAQHVDLLNELKETLANKNKTIEELDVLITEIARQRSEEEIKQEVGQRLAILQENHDKVLEEYEALAAELDTERSKTIWQKLFGK